MFTRSNQSFEPRVGTAQLVFAIIYIFITLCILSLAFYVRSLGNEPYLHFFMAALFAIMALKSFIIYKRVKKLVNEGVATLAEVDSCEAVRGITVLKGTCEVKDFGFIHIESRLVGETVASEIQRYMKDHKLTSLPALVVGADTQRPRGMFTVACDHGHLIEKSCLPANEQQEATEQEQTITSEDLKSPEAIIAEIKAAADAEEKAAKEANEAKDAEEQAAQEEAQNESAKEKEKTTAKE